MNTEIEKLKMEVAALRAKTTPLCEGLAEEYQQAQLRADGAFQAVGHDGAPAHLLGESLTDYRLRLLRGVQSKSSTWKSVELPRRQDVLNVVEPQIYADAKNSVTDPANYKPGELKQVVSLDQTGRRITKFYGDNSVTWAPFQPKVNRYVTGFSK